MLGVAVGEEQRKFVTRHARPVADAAGVQMYEWDSRGGIVANAPAFAHEARIAELFYRYIGEVDVGSLSQDMARLFGLTAAFATQLFIGLGGTEP